MQLAKFILKPIFRKFGVLPYVRGLRILLDGDHFPAAMMRFPTYDPGINKLLGLGHDYFRYATIGLAIRRIQSENIEGDFAECGVYRGDMSKFVCRLAPERLN